MPQLFLSGTPIGDIQGVLFDKDGTLSNSENYLIQLAELRIQESINRFEVKGFDFKKTNQLRQLLSKSFGITEKGVSPSGIIAIAARHENLIATATVFCLLGENWPNSYALANEIFYEADLLIKKVPPHSIERTLLPGALELLNELSRKGVTCGLISNDSHSGIQRFLQDNGLEKIFKSFWSAEDNPPKPNPFAVRELCNRLGLPTTKCALIGDSESDLQMSRKAKISLTMGYNSGWKNPPNLYSYQYLINHWDQLTI